MYDTALEAAAKWEYPRGLLTSAVVSTPAWHSVVRGSILGPAMLYFRCKNLALNIRECVSLVGHGSSVVGVQLRNVGKFVYPTLPVSFG